MLDNENTRKREKVQTYDLNILEEASSPTNKALIIGKIRSNIFQYAYVTRQGERFYKVIVSVLRKSKERDIITIVIPENLLKEHFTKPIRGKYIKAIGNFCSHLHKLENEGKKNWLELFVLAEQIDIYDSRPEYDFNNCVYLEGRVNKKPFSKKPLFYMNITELFITVRRNDTKRLDYIPCITWGDLADEAKNLQIGDMITVKGRIQSREYFEKTKDNPNVGVYREVHDVSVCEIIKVEKADTQ